MIGLIVASKACPLFTIVAEDETAQRPGKPVERFVRFRAMPVDSSALFGGAYGDLTVELGSKKSSAPVRVTYHWVNDVFQRCGVGTRLYHAAAKFSCEQYSAPLASDKLRSASSHGFWIKQVAKGRAECAKPARRLTQSERREIATDSVAYGRGNCDHYQLKSCPVPETLAGKRRR